jgi:hypothetical protein
MIEREVVGRRKNTLPKHSPLFFTVFTAFLALAACKSLQIPPEQAVSRPPAPTLTLSARNIVVTQEEYTHDPCGGGRLHVWSFNNGEYENTWTAKTFKFSNIALGDVDGDAKREIVALGHCKMEEIKQRDVIEYYKYFICVYKEDQQVGQNEMGIWKTTCYDGLKNNIREEEHYYPQYSWSREIALADVDGDDINEIIVMTGHWLTVYEYDPNAVDRYNDSLGTLKKIAEVRPTFSKKPVRLKSVTVRDGDGKTGKEIVVTANREKIVKYISGVYSRYIENDGYVFFYKFNDESLELSSCLPIKAFLTDQSLRSGDLDNDGTLELCSTGFKKTGDMYQGYLFIWDYTSQWELHEIPVGVPENIMIEEGFETYTPRNHLEIGELNTEHPGEEIVLALQHQMLVTLCYWEGGAKLTTINNATLYDYYFVEIENVYIADTDGDEKNEIVVTGAGRSGPESGRFYLEIFDENLTRKWYRLGGNSRETDIASAAIG